MIKYTILIFIFITVTLSLIYFKIGQPTIYLESKFSIPSPHLYNDTKQSIKKIHLVAVYFVPKNKQPVSEMLWKNSLEEVIAKLRLFHAVAFRDRSKISYSIYPRVVIGEKDNLIYDTNVTDQGNPEALRNVQAELETRLLTKGGDLYDISVMGDEKDYTALYILYEGVGAAGASKTALLNRKFLTEIEYQSIGSTLFAHEFYHTLDIPDQYQITDNVSTSNDIMGLGRFQPLEYTFLDNETLAKLGL